MTETTKRAVLSLVLPFVGLLVGLAWTSTARAGELTEVAAARAPALDLPDLDGQTRSLDEFAGKVLVVNFWASWCSPCIQELPSLQRLASAMRDHPFALVTVNVGESARRARTALQRAGVDFTVLLDAGSTAFAAWGANVFPTTYVLDPDGRIRYLGRGPLDWDRDDIIAALRALARAEAAAPPDL